MESIILEIFAHLKIAFLRLFQEDLLTNKIDMAFILS